MQIHLIPPKTLSALKPEGQLMLTDQTRQFRANITSEAVALFTDLPSDILSKEMRVQIQGSEGLPYICLDSTLRINEPTDANVHFSIKGIDLAQGIVWDKSSLKPIHNAQVSIAGRVATTNEQEAFTLSIPEDKQLMRQELRVWKEKYKPFRASMSMIGEQELQLFLDVEE